MLKCSEKQFENKRLLQHVTDQEVNERTSRNQDLSFVVVSSNVKAVDLKSAQSPLVNDNSFLLLQHLFGFASHKLILRKYCLQLPPMAVDLVHRARYPIIDVDAQFSSVLTMYGCCTMMRQSLSDKGLKIEGVAGSCCHGFQSFIHDRFATKTARSEAVPNAH